MHYILHNELSEMCNNSMCSSKLQLLKRVRTGQYGCERDTLGDISILELPLFI